MKGESLNKMKVITVDNDRLRGKTVGQSEKIAEELDMHTDTLRRKLKNAGEWRLKDLNKLCQVLDLDPEKVVEFIDTEK